MDHESGTFTYVPFIFQDVNLLFIICIYFTFMCLECLACVYVCALHVCLEPPWPTEVSDPLELVV